jgi:hypothetical protein
MSTAKLRKILKRYFKNYRLAIEEKGAYQKLTNFPPFPEECRGMICAARTKSTGRPCKRRDIFGNGRCPLHGGLSKGPTSPEGRARALMNLKNTKYYTK